MLKNYLKIAYRNLVKHKVYSLINLLGLAIGLAASLLIGIYLLHELSYDRFHENASQVHRIYWKSGASQTRTPHPMALQLVADFPEVIAGTSLTPMWGPGLTRPHYPVRYGDKLFEEREILAVDTTFFQVFTFPFISGSPKTALHHPNGVVISESAAKRYFGEEAAVGKLLRIGERTDFQVTAVLEDVPETAHFRFDFLLPYPFMKNRDNGDFYTWRDFGHYNYIKLATGIEKEDLEQKMIPWASQFIDFSEANIQAMNEGSEGFQLQAITNIHLHSHLRWELEPNSHISYIYLLLSAALLTLVLACVNFMNLSTARSMERAREIGLRKTLGAQRHQLIGQFIGEAVLFCGLSILLAAGITDLTLPMLSSLTGKTLSFSLLGGYIWLPILIGLGMFVALLAGAYPAFYLSGIKPLQSMKGRFSHSKKGVMIRKGLVVFQFVISTSLIGGTLIIFQQIQHLQQSQLGFDKAHMLVVPLTAATADQYKVLKGSIARVPEVVQTSAISNVPGGLFNQNSIRWKDERVSISELSVDEDFFACMGLEVTVGRSFFPTPPADSTRYYMLNETAARQFSWDQPMEEQVIWEDDDRDKQGSIIGIVKDFNFQSLHHQIGPIAFKMQPDDYNYLLIKINGKAIPKTLSQISHIWEEMEPARPFTYSFLDDDFDALYQSEHRMGSLFAIFTGLALLIACLGLFGLATFATAQRTRELGIRKIMGASALQIISLLTRDFLKLVLLAFALATPIFWWAMHLWLQGFAYQVTLSPWLFIGTGMFSVVLAAVTVGILALRAAQANPVEALRYE